MPRIYDYDIDPDSTWRRDASSMLRTQLSSKDDYDVINPYVVQRCRADRALDPDASWQTDANNA